MKRFCDYLREHAMKLINFKMKKNELLIKESKNHMKMLKSARFLKKNLKRNIWNIKVS